ncbi:MAG: serine hydroxymethyltransferase [Candidatus Bathyarchaeota archaeon]|uniref:serine hydroxymethyltransferase n=1 Tax=Candidatus Bathycorpusculum sp. TaxID=2994959 RepID=UPI00281BECE0|nr:serine hydroxymethyltransferase [Candidatus Termiticorpusculum sp.]MCL2292650.1 serine hydroxymethyltransferase [Candidatus Termiticorpusculum sp.]
MKDLHSIVLDLIKATRNHEQYRDRECINMIASEGIKSPAVCQMLDMSHDLATRYAEGNNNAEGHVEKRFYQGQKYSSQIEDYAADAIKRLFNATWADVRLISGTHANTATFKGLALAAKNNRIVVTPLSCGAHISHDYTGLAGSVLGLENINHVYDVNEFNIDPDKSAYVIRATKPGIVTFGGSLFLFPHPIKELKEACSDVGAYIAYDAAHVLGLIAGGQFQDPLREGADFITASTHKTFPGPQGGVIMGIPDTSIKEKAVRKIQHAVFPLTASSTHLGRLPALGLACLEMKVFGQELAAQIVKNAQVAGQYLYENGIKVVAEHKGFTKSHQLALDVRVFGGGNKIAQDLEDANVILNKNLLPYDDQNDKENPAGLRVGFQDVTRHGMREGDIKHLCDLIMDVIKGKRTSEQVKVDVMALKREFSEVKYGFQNVEEAIKYAKT